MLKMLNNTLQILEDYNKLNKQQLKIKILIYKIYKYLHDDNIFTKIIEEEQIDESDLNKYINSIEKLVNILEKN